MNDIEIIKLYKQGKTADEIGKMSKFGRNKIAKILKNNNIQIKGRKGYKKYYFDEYYFDRVDNEHKAYWLGWFFSDGYNQQSRNTIKLQIQQKDICILEQLKKDINYNGPIRNTKNNQVLIFLISKYLSERLAEIGCIQRKSLKLEFPLSLPQHLYPHFLRGYFDGDGCISGTKNNFQFTIISTEKFCNKINDIFQKFIGKKILENHPNNDITKRYRIGGRKQIRKIYEYLYNNATVYLSRKKEKIERLLCI